MGWLDLINIGIDAAQSYQIYKARDQLKHLETGAAAEALRKEVLGILRDFIFQSVQNMKTLEQHLETSPQAVYLTARSLQVRFDDIGISPEIFPEFRDKEYLQEAQRKITDII